MNKPGGLLSLAWRQLRRDLAAGDIRILPIYPKHGQAARRVIVDAGKDRRSPDTLLPGLSLHNEDGSYTDAALAILRRAEALL